MMALVMESAERGLDQALQLADGALDGCLNRGRTVGDSDRLATGETRFHHAALVVTAALAAVLVAEVDFHSRDALLVSAERGCDDGAPSAPGEATLANAVPAPALGATAGVGG